MKLAAAVLLGISAAWAGPQAAAVAPPILQAGSAASRTNAPAASSRVEGAILVPSSPAPIPDPQPAIACSDSVVLASLPLSVTDVGSGAYRGVTVENAANALAAGLSTTTGCPGSLPRRCVIVVVPAGAATGDARLPAPRLVRCTAPPPRVHPDYRFL